MRTRRGFPGSAPGAGRAHSALPGTRRPLIWINHKPGARRENELGSPCSLRRPIHYAPVHPHRFFADCSRAVARAALSLCLCRGIRAHDGCAGLCDRRRLPGPHPAGAIPCGQRARRCVLPDRLRFEPCTGIVAAGGLRAALTLDGEHSDVASAAADRRATTGPPATNPLILPA